MWVRSFVRAFVGALLAIGLWVTPASAGICASATSCTLSLDESQAFGPGTFGTVALTLNGSAIDIAINLNPDLIIDTGSHYAVTFNSSAPTQVVTIGSFTDPGNPSPFKTNATYTQQTDPGGYKNAPYQKFDHAIASSCTNGGGCGDKQLSFVVNTGGGFSNVSQLVALDTAGDAYFAVDISINGTTGVVGADGRNPVPEPGSYLAVLLIGVGAVGFVRVRRQRSGVA